MSSPLVTQFRRGGVSKDVRLTAATGALPLSPADQIEASIPSDPGQR